MRSKHFDQCIEVTDTGTKINNFLSYCFLPLDIKPISLTILLLLLLLYNKMSHREKTYFVLCSAVTKADDSETINGNMLGQSTKNPNVVIQS